jgi:hypothetical protein
VTAATAAAEVSTTTASVDHSPGRVEEQSVGDHEDLATSVR